MNNIRLTRKPFLKDFTFHKEESKLHLIAEDIRGSLEGKKNYYEELLTPFEYKIIHKIYKYHPNNLPFRAGVWEGEKSYIREMLSVVTYIIETFSLEEVEFIDLDKETFKKWKTFREWYDIVEDNSNVQ